MAESHKTESKEYASGLLHLWEQSRCTLGLERKEGRIAVYDMLAGARIIAIVDNMQRE